jgi:hypothetical protein
MKPEKQQLLDDLLEAEGQREAILSAGGQILRQRRHRRAVVQIGSLMALAAAVALVLEQRQPASHHVLQSPTVESRPAPFQVKTLTDAELLALFPNTPVALATLSNGKKVFLFLRPADDAKFAVHL